MITAAEIKLFASLFEGGLNFHTQLQRDVIIKALRFYAEHSPDVKREDQWNNFPPSNDSSAEFLSQQKRSAS